MLRLCRYLLVSIVSLSLIFAMTSCVAPGQTTKVSSGDIDTFRSSLEKSDFTLRLAPFIQVDLIELYEAGKVANAGGNNANAPYRGVFGALPDNIKIKDIQQLAGTQDKIQN